MSNSDKKHPIRVVARRTGTSETTLRAWERRYGAVEPERAETGRRLYSDDDIERLSLIRAAVDAGRPVSSVAQMSNAELVELVDEDRTSKMISPPRERAATSQALRSIIDAAMEAILQLDARLATSVLSRAMLKYSAPVWIDSIVVPMMRQIGERWHDGELSPRHEHLATTVVRTLLNQMQSGVQHSLDHSIVVATPVRQFHDLGTQFVSALAVSEGWNVINLGANVPAEDIVLAARESSASVVALSIVHPAADPGVGRALAYLAKNLDPSVTLIVGGQAALSYSDGIESAKGIFVDSSPALADLLLRLSET
jgi:methanogenic corrinoid protein MtbC1